jgi:gliding motility-associated-like protein
MTVKPVLDAGVSLGYAPATICSGKPVVFTADATDAGAVPDYAWMVNGVAVGAGSGGAGGSGGLGSGGATFTSSTLGNGDVVGVEVSDPASCVVPADASVTVVVNASPTVGGGGAVLLSKGQSYLLDLPVTGDIVSYTWQPGVWLSDSTVVNPMATPLATTDYTLTVVSPQGCVASDSILLKVFSKLAIPAAFSPNADGHNDIFYVIGGPIGSKIGDFAVYDRWGQAVFAVHGVAPDDPAYGWNGNINGRPAPTGTYVYALRMVFADGTQEVVKGTVILVR